MELPDYDGMTFSANPPKDLTMADILAGAAAINALPPVVNEITVSPDILQQLRPLAADASTPMSGRMQVYVDTSLPARTWHEGPPR